MDPARHRPKISSENKRRIRRKCDNIRSRKLPKGEHGPPADRGACETQSTSQGSE